MSGNWLDLSSTSNRFVQTYIKGFVDISGGNLLLRNNSLILNAGDISLNGRLYIGSDTSLNGNVYVGGFFGANTLAIGKTAVTPGYNLDVNGTVLFEGDVSFGGNVSVNNLSVGGVIQQNSSGSINSSLVSFTYSSISTFAQTTTVNSYTNTNTFLANTYFMSDVSLVGRLYVSNDVSLSGYLTINKAAYILGDASLSGRLYVANDVSLGGRLYVTNDVSLGGRLYVTNDVSLGGRLYVANDVSLGGRLYITNDVSLGGRLYVANDASLGGRLYAKSDVSCNGNTAIGGNLSVNGNIYGNFAASTIPISAIVGGNTSIVDLSYNQTINGNKTFTGLITMTYDMSINRGNLYVGNNTVLGGDVSMNGRLYVGGDVSINGNVFVNTGLFLGQRLGLGQGYILDISSSNTNGYGAMRIYESVKGTVPTASGGSLIIQHADVSGVSSIVFPSTTNYGKDYGSIAYYEAVYGTKYNYYNTTQSTASSALVVNVQKDGPADTKTMDSIILQAAGSVIIDASQTILQPKGGPVGIGKTNPNSAYALDVSGIVICNYSTTTSDYRIKENVREIPDEYSIDDLNPCSYYNTLLQKEEVGFLAHEVQEKFPFLVSGEKDGEQYQALNYIGIIGLLVKEIKALKKAAQTLPH
jgi:predicted acyltransferase (DUF342 family)